MLSDIERDPPRLRALRHVVRSRVAEHPAFYVPFARWKYPGPSPNVVGRDTELVIDGYTRSACTFAVYALQIAQRRPVRLAHHLHAPAQLLMAARLGIPALVVIRRPCEVVASQVVREPHVALRDALVSYARFHERLLPFARSFVAGEFEEVTKDPGAVVRRVNDRFGTSFIPLERSPAAFDRCFDLIRERPTTHPEWRRMLLGFESGVVSLDEIIAARPRFPDAATDEGREVWVPSRHRTDRKRAVLGRLQEPALARLRDRAQRSYEDFLSSTGHAAPS